MTSAALTEAGRSWPRLAEAGRTARLECGVVHTLAHSCALERGALWLVHSPALSLGFDGQALTVTQRARQGFDVKKLRANKTIVEALATGFYFGKAPFMPGTFGTVWGIPLAWALIKLGTIPYMVITVVLILFASLIAELHERNTARHDPKEIVIDEVVGYLVTMTMLPVNWQSFLGAFLAFRFFDILKPFPIRAIDQRVKGGLGTVLDDVAAGLAANVVLQVIFNQTSWLGETWHV